MFDLLMLLDVEACHFLRASECHAHLPIFVILVPILLLHLADLGMLAAFDLTHVHHLIVVRGAAVLIISTFLVTTLFATFASFTIIFTRVILDPVATCARRTISPLFPTFSATSSFLIRLRILFVSRPSVTLAHLHNGYLLVVILLLEANLRSEDLVNR